MILIIAAFSFFVSQNLNEEMNLVENQESIRRSIYSHLQKIKLSLFNSYDCYMFLKTSNLEDNIFNDGAGLVFEKKIKSRGDLHLIETSTSKDGVLENQNFLIIFDEKSLQCGGIALFNNTTT
jgi:hypothetical protein